MNWTMYGGISSDFDEWNRRLCVQLESIHMYITSKTTTVSSTTTQHQYAEYACVCVVRTHRILPGITWMKATDVGCMSAQQCTHDWMHKHINMHLAHTQAYLNTKWIYTIKKYIYMYNERRKSQIQQKRRYLLRISGINKQNGGIWFPLHARAFSYIFESTFLMLSTFHFHFYFIKSSSNFIFVVVSLKNVLNPVLFSL